MEKTKIRLCIVSHMIDDEGRLHRTKTAHRGFLTIDARGTVLEYDDEQEGERAHITLTCSGGRAAMQRAGAVSALLRFEPGKRVESRYVTIYGDIGVATDTRRVVLLGDEKGGQLTLDYSVYAGGAKTSDALLEISWRA